MHSVGTSKILIVDNYDSFTFNLYQLIGSFKGTSVDVFRNDEITIEEIVQENYTAIVLSPGPGNPQNSRDFGICTEIISQLKQEIPILGVCLGHQGMGHILEGKVIRANRILHGKVSVIKHTGQGIFAQIPQYISVARYHSLILEKHSLPDSITITAETEEGEIMAIQHKYLPLYGVQFHPESFMTEFGREIISNFLELSKKVTEVPIEV